MVESLESAESIMHDDDEKPNSDYVNQAEKGSHKRVKNSRIRGKWHPSKWVYALLFVVVNVIAVALLQRGVALSVSRVDLSSPRIGFRSFVSAMWTDHRFVFVLNLLAIGLVYLFLLFLFNRFWIATTVLLSTAGIIAVIEHFKVVSRYETILPSDLHFLEADTGNIVSFLPKGSLFLIITSVVLILLLVLVTILLSRIDYWHGRVVRTSNKGIGASVRFAGALIPMLVLTLFMSSVGTYGTWANSFARFMGDRPSMWDSVYDSQSNGTFLSFSRQLNPRIMEKPADYNEATMKDIELRYSKQADTINQQRHSYLDESTVVYILSESFSDPTRVPGVQLNADPMPNIRAMKNETTSGLMLSSGYGGGTANLEFQALSGLSMANFDPSLTSPYQQVVPDLNWMPMMNHYWGAEENSQAFHPYEPSMYSRAQNYKTFGFSHFYALAGSDIINHQDKVDASPYVSDQAAYQSALDEMESNKASQFVEVITMQNHMPYNDWYRDSPFQVSTSENAPTLTDDELSMIRTYAKGVNLTDNATQSFVNSINKLDKPVTVVFYGDHLPGIYTTASADANNSLALHLTDYFIWSNDASKARNTELSHSAYTSPNFFGAQTAQHMDAKVSPYLAFLTNLKDKISAIEPPVVNQIQGWERIPEGQTIYLDAEGKPMDARTFDMETQQLLHDYKLIQYDIMAGKQYLRSSDFMTAPTRSSDEKIAESTEKREGVQQTEKARKEQATVPAEPEPTHTSAQ